MASGFRSICGDPLCRKLADPGHYYCSACQHKRTRRLVTPDMQRPRTYDLHRPNANARGYDKRWSRLAHMVRRRQPICAVCMLKPSECVDHVLPKALGGTDDLTNLQGLCWACHSRKTLKETRAGV